WVRTLAKVAEYKCRTLPPAPAAPRTGSGQRAGWRRADVLVAAALLVVVGALATSGLARLWTDRHRVECANNLHKFHEALEAYADNRHGQCPKVEAEAPKNFAGSFVPALNEARAMPPGLSISCPGDPPRPPSALTFAELEKMRHDKPDEFRNNIKGLG